MEQSGARNSGESAVIFILIDQLDAWRGTETQLYRLLSALDSTRFTTVLGVLGEAGLAEEFRQRGARVHELAVYSLGSVRGVLRAIDLLRLLRQERTHLLVSFHTASDLLAPILASWAGIPTISCRRDEGFTKRRRHVVFQRFLNRRVAGMISVSHAVARAVLRTESFPLDRNLVIWNGEDLEAFKPGPAGGREALGIAPDECIVTCVAGLAPQKDHATLIRAFELALAEHPNSRLLLVGEGSERERLGDQARPLGGRVMFLGARRDVPDILRWSDIYAQTSVTEGFSNSILQAMATGLPVVATRVGGNRELVPDSCGFLVPTGEPAAASRALTQLMRDGNLRRSLGHAGRQWAVRHLSVEAMATRYADAFEQALEGRLRSSIGDLS